MATRVKEGLAGKEKRGISPSRKSPSTSKQSSPNKRHDSTTAERSIPNYLKPTISSSLDPSKQQVKKHPSSNIVHKAPPARRRSLEKPLPASHIPKTRTSPNPRERNIHSSSSFTSRTTATSQKSPSDRLLKAPKHDGKEHSMHPRSTTAKKSSISLKKQEPQDGTFSSKPPSEIPPGKVDTPDVAHDIPQVLELREEDPNSSIIENNAELLNEGKSNVVFADDIDLVLEDKVHVIVNQAEPESHEVEEDKMIEPSPGLKENHDAILGATLQEPEDNLQVREVTSNHSEILEQEHGEKEKDINHQHEENVEEEPKVEVQKQEGENAIQDTVVQTLDKNEQKNDVSEVLDSQHETHPAEGVAKELNQDTERATTKPEVVQGKKDSAVVSNDVIEETASKLREQRKNKVKALAGAFETVISLQENK